MKTTAAAMLMLFTGAACAISPLLAQSGAHIRFTVENPQLEPSAYTLEVFENGIGSYTEKNRDAQSADQAIKIQDPLLAKLFQAARANHFFAIDCESQQKVAFTGKKTLDYKGGDGAGSCTFNYSRDAALNQIAADLMAVAFTVQEGERLKSEHLHDRLSLDAELESLQNAAKDRRALEIENIEPELQSIAEDEDVMNLARNRARALLREPGSR